MAFLMISRLCSTAMGYDPEPNSDAPEKYSAIVEADGFVFLSEDRTLKEIREDALATAKREALERGQTYIKSVTRSENFQLAYDLIHSAAEGHVRIIESRDHGITPDNRYHYWIKAEIEYSIKTPDSIHPVINSEGPLSVRVWTEKQEYRTGDEVRIHIQGNKDFYARIIYIDVHRNRLQLVPNRFRANNRFPEGLETVIPGNTDGFRLKVVPPYGREQIVVYASTVPLGEIETEPVGESIYKVNFELGKIGELTRGIKIIPVENELPAAEFFETTWEIVIRE